MLLNPSPSTPTAVPNHPGTFKQFTYVLLNPSSHAPGVVSIAAILYKDEDAFLAGQVCGDAYLGTIQFDIDTAGLLTACETYAITLFPGFISVNPPTAPIDNA